MCNKKDIKESLKVFERAIIKMQEDTTLKYLKNPRIGLSMQDWEIDESAKDNFAELDPNATFYYYSGPLDDKTRPFCQEMLIIGKFFSQEDLDFLSLKLGYDVFLEEGRWNCRHKWVRARIKQRIKDGFIPDQPDSSDLDDLDSAAEDSGIIR